MKKTKKRAKRNSALPRGEKVLILRTCNADMTAYGGFVWPQRGIVVCPDWKPTAECGNGFHGALWGEGEGSLFNWSSDAKWLVVEALASETFDLRGKVKYPRCRVVFCGDRKGATDYLYAHLPPGQARSVIGGTSTSGVGGTSTSGYGGTSTSGDCGTSTSGDCGTSTSGDGGTSTSGYGGTSTSGDCGLLQIKWHDGKCFRIANFYVGEDGIEANVPYRCEGGKAVMVKP